MQELLRWLLLHATEPVGCACRSCRSGQDTPGAPLPGTLPHQPIWLVAVLSPSSDPDGVSRAVRLMAPAACSIRTLQQMQNTIQISAQPSVVPYPR